MGLVKYLLPPTVLAIIAGVVAAGIFDSNDQAGRVLILGVVSLVFIAWLLAPGAFRLMRQLWRGGPQRLVDRVVLRRRLASAIVILTIFIGYAAWIAAGWYLGPAAGFSALGGVVALGAALKLASWRMDQRLHRRLSAARGAICPGCGYRLDEIIGGTCPECGEWTASDSARQVWHRAIGSWAPRRRRRRRR